MNRKSIYYLLAAFTGLVLLLFFAISNSKNTRKLKAEELLSRTTITEKERLEKDLTNMQANYSSLKQTSDQNADLLKQTAAKLSETVDRINYLTRENRSLAANKKELSQLKELKADLESRLERLSGERDRLAQENSSMQASLDKLEKEKNELLAQLEKTNMYRTDNFLATATRGKKTERIVVRAARARKLNLTFEIPSNLTQNLSFKIFTPDGKSITPDNKNLSWHFPVEQRNVTASLSAVTGEFTQSRAVALNYNATEKLVKGEYRIQILTEGVAIGTCRLSVR